MSTVYALPEDDEEVLLTTAELRQLLIDSIDEMNDGATDD